MSRHILLLSALLVYISICPSKADMKIPSAKTLMEKDLEAEHVDSDGDSSIKTGLKLGSSLKKILVESYEARNHKWGHTLSLGTISETDELLLENSITETARDGKRAIKGFNFCKRGYVITAIKAEDQNDNKEQSGWVGNFTHGIGKSCVYIAGWSPKGVALKYKAQIYGHKK